MNGKFINTKLVYLLLAGSSLGGSAVKTVVSRAGPFTQQLFILCRPELSFNNTEKGYNFPSYRDPAQPWILMSYESGNSIRQRAHYKVLDMMRKW